MPRSRLLLALAAPAVLAACASAPPADYWTNARGRSAAEFALDNEHCGAAATRVTPTPRADQLAGGIVAPHNRIDRPPERFANAVADRTYMDCMAAQGWRVARR